MEIYNTVLTRSFSNCNYTIVKIWYEKNKKKIEYSFFENNILASGTIKKIGKSIIEVLYIKYYSEKLLDLKEIHAIYNQAKTQLPVYEDYLAYIKKNRETDVVNKIIKHITYTSLDEEYLSPDIFNMYSEKMRTQLIVPFVYKNSYLPSNENLKMNDIQETVYESDLAFIGKYLCINKVSLKTMLSHKLLEKLFGSCEQEGLYFQYREKGWIYTGLSGYICDSDIFYSGAILQYNAEHEQRIMESIVGFEFNSSDLKKAKEMVLDDYRFTVFQYGTEFALLPYNMKLGGKFNFEEEIENIAEDDVQFYKNEICCKGCNIRMKVN